MVLFSLGLLGCHFSLFARSQGGTDLKVQTSHLVSSCATCLLIIPCMGSIPEWLWVPGFREVRFWFLFDAMTVTVGASIILPSLMVLAWFDTSDLTLPSILYGSRKSSRSLALKSISCILAIIINLASLLAIGVLLDIPHSHFTVASIFQRISILGHVIGATLYGIGTVNTPFDLIIKPPKAPSPDELDDLQEHMHSIQLESFHESPVQRGADSPTAGMPVHYRDLMLDLSDHYDRLLSAKAFAESRLYPVKRAFGYIMLIIGVYRLVDTCYNVLMAITPKHGEAPTEVTNVLTTWIIDLLHLPLNATAISNLVYLIYVSILVGNSMNGFRNIVSPPA